MEVKGVLYKRVPLMYVRLLEWICPPVRLLRTRLDGSGSKEKTEGSNVPTERTALSCEKCLRRVGFASSDKERVLTKRWT